MIEQKKLYKLCKYFTKMKKSFIDNDINNYSKYCSHLKYHIGEQIGNGTNPELDELFDSVINLISNNKQTYNVEYIKKKIIEEKNQLEKKLEEYELQIYKLKINNQLISENKLKLETNIESYKKIIEENNQHIKKDKLELDETKSKIQLFETEIKNNLEKIMNLEKQILDMKNELIETNKKLEDIYSKEKIIDKLKDLQQNNYQEFIDLLEELFTQIYNKDIAYNIINEISLGENWKDNIEQKMKREETEILVNGKMEKWSDVLNTLEFTKTNTSKKLIDDINKYLNEGLGDVNSLITRYESELDNSVKEIISKQQKPIDLKISKVPIMSYKQIPQISQIPQIPQTSKFNDYSKIMIPQKKNINFKISDNN